MFDIRPMHCGDCGAVQMFACCGSELDSAIVHDCSCDSWMPAIAVEDEGDED